LLNGNNLSGCGGSGAGTPSGSTASFSESDVYLCTNMNSGCCHKRVRLEPSAGFDGIDDSFKLCTALEEIEIADGFRSIVSNAFEGYR